MNWCKMEMYLYNSRSNRKIIGFVEDGVMVSDTFFLQIHYIYERLKNRTMYIKIKVKGYMYV